MDAVVPFIAGGLGAASALFAVLWLLEGLASLLAGFVPRRARRRVHPSPEPRELPELLGPRR